MISNCPCLANVVAYYGEQKEEHNEQQKANMSKKRLWKFEL